MLFDPLLDLKTFEIPVKYITDMPYGSIYIYNINGINFQFFVDRGKGYDSTIFVAIFGLHQKTHKETDSVLP